MHRPQGSRSILQAGGGSTIGSRPPGVAPGPWVGTTRALPPCAAAAHERQPESGAGPVRGSVIVDAVEPLNTRDCSAAGNSGPWSRTGHDGGVALQEHAHQRFPRGAVGRVPENALSSKLGR